jgi:hypothetical protein
MKKKRNCIFDRRLSRRWMGRLNKHILKLYVAGNTSRSQAAIMNIRKICESTEGTVQAGSDRCYQSGAGERGQIIAAA